MTLSKISVTVFGAALLLGSSAFAAKDTNKTTLDLSQTVSVNGQTLAPGKYRVEWEGTGPNVELKVLQHNKTIATVPAEIQQQGTQNPESAYGSTTGPNGTKQLVAIYPGGKREVLQIKSGINQNEQSQSQQSMNPSSK